MTRESSVNKLMTELGTGNTVDEASSNGDIELSREELGELTVAQLRTLSEELEITLTSTKKDDIITEILAAREESDSESDAEQKVE